MYDVSKPFTLTPDPLAFYVSPSSCGVQELYGVDMCRDAQRLYLSIILHLKRHYGASKSLFYQRQGNWLPALALIWSGRRGDGGHLLAKYLIEKFPDNPPRLIENTSPVSGRDIIVAMWELRIQDLLPLPEWNNMENVKIRPNNGSGWEEFKRPYITENNPIVADWWKPLTEEIKEKENAA